MAMEIETVVPKYNSQNYQVEKDWSISTEHCYARPWNWRPESNFLRPTRTLFVAKQLVNKNRSNNPLAPLQDFDDEVDVKTIDESTYNHYDISKSKHLMEECERHISVAKLDDDTNDWEETISRFNWTQTQNRLFNGVANILNSEYLARSAYAGSPNEVILRRTLIDKSVQRMRRLLATVSWDPKLLQWLHLLLIENLNKHYLASYLDILQTLKAKVPTFVDMMLGTISSRLGALSNENIYSLLKYPWEPVISNQLLEKPKKLPTNPIIVIITSGLASSKRYHKWVMLLSSLGTVVTIPVNLGASSHRMTMVNYLDQMYASARAKIQELRSDYPGRNIALLGFNTGAALALQIAQVEPVLCVICLGFSLHTAEGKRGDPEDSLLELQCPVLFIIGQCACRAVQEELEDLRERMRVETGLVIVGSADDYLRVNIKKKRLEGITQSIIDKYIVDEVGEFISGVILSPYPPQIRQSPTHVSPDIKKVKNERKRYNSNASSIDSEPPSPTPRITRPVGRPPGSRSKSKLEAKWTNQVKHGYSFSTRVGVPSSTMSTFIPAGMKSQNTKSTSNIKVLENVTLNPGGSKLVSNANRTIDLSKITMLNSVPTKSTNGLGNIVLLPDGKLKPIRSPVKGGKYITSKKQLIGNKPPKPKKKISYVSHTSVQSSLPPPTNLTTEDIMDLPIIFADDNQILEPNSIQPEILTPETVSVSQLHPLPQPLPQTQPSQAQLQSSKIITSAGNKFVLLNKQVTSQPSSNFIITPTSLKKMPPITTVKNPKYTKIILSKRDESNKGSVMTHISNLSPEISVRKIISDRPTAVSAPVTLPIILTATAASASGSSTLPAAPPPVSVLTASSVPTTSHCPVTVPTATSTSIPVARSTMVNVSSTPLPTSRSSTIVAVNLAPSSVHHLPAGHNQHSLPESIDLENELTATAVPKPNLSSSDVKNITIITKNTPEDVKSEFLTKNVELPEEEKNLKRKAFDTGYTVEYIQAKLSKLE